jgi:hypothetical protein
MHRPFNAAAVRLQDFNLAAIVYMLDDVDMLGLALSKEGNQLCAGDCRTSGQSGRTTPASTRLTINPHHMTKPSLVDQV